MPFLIPVIAALGGLFVGSQVDNAVQSAASKPAIIDQSKTPWWVNLLITGAVIYLAFIVLKRIVK